MEKNEKNEFALGSPLSLSEQVIKNTNNIGKEVGDIETNKDNIDINTYNINTIADKSEVNRNNIVNNKNDIDDNEINIDDNKTNIDNNKKVNEIQDNQIELLEVNQAFSNATVVLTIPQNKNISNSTYVSVLDAVGITNPSSLSYYLSNGVYMIYNTGAFLLQMISGMSRSIYDGGIVNYRTYLEIYDTTIKGWVKIDSNKYPETDKTVTKDFALYQTYAGLTLSLYYVIEEMPEEGFVYIRKMNQVTGSAGGFNTNGGGNINATLIGKGGASGGVSQGYVDNQDEIILNASKGYSQSVPLYIIYDEIKTTDKTIIGAINELNAEKDTLLYSGYSGDKELSESFNNFNWLYVSIRENVPNSAGKVSNIILCKDIILGTMKYNYIGFITDPYWIEFISDTNFKTSTSEEVRIWGVNRKNN